jgi:hypothetical protein
VPTARSRNYVVRTTFRAAMPFVLRWCTDYTPEDAGLEGEKFRRRVLERARRKVVYEDLDDLTGGWFWSRWVVTIHPPDRWHGSAVGNYRCWEIDYRLRPRGADRTELTIRGRRTPCLLGSENPPKAELERDLAKTWKRLSRALEADYRKSAGKRAGRGRRR